MSLAKDFAVESVGRNRSQIQLIIEQLSGNDLRDFIEALNDRNIPNAAIARVMERRGFKLDAKRVSEYRLGSNKYGLDGKYVAK
jgi:hypothetical protein